MSLDVSVVVVTYNQAEQLRRALDSVIEQTRPPDQIVVSDDASTDNTEAVIREYAERHPDLIDVRLNERNRGIAANVNDGLEAVDSDLVTILAGDDWFLPQKLEREIECYQDMDAQVVFSDVLHMNESGRKKRRWGEDSPPTGDVFRDVFARDLFFRTWLQPTETLDTVGFWDEHYDLFADWDYVIRLTEQCEVAYVPEPLSVYRQHRESTTSRIEQRERLKWVKTVYERNRHRLSRLNPTDREYIEGRMEGHLTRFSCSAAIYDGEYTTAARELLRYLRNDYRDRTLLELSTGFLRARLARLV